jgi:hypothetical protein
MYGDADAGIFRTKVFQITHLPRERLLQPYQVRIMILDYVRYMDLTLFP